MIKKSFILFSIVFLLVFAISISLSFVSAADCWQYTANSTCSQDSGCSWKNDSWGAWCQELSCWSLWSQDTCTTTNVPGKNCTWSGGNLYSYCTEVSCYTFDGANEASCENNTNSLSCDWSDICYHNGGSGGTDCPMINTEATCVNTTGCSWGHCSDKGCWSYTDSTNCSVSRDWRGNNCTWDTSGYCKERNCWQYNNQTDCDDATGISCNWKWNSCQETNCWTWDGTNATACINNSANLTCNWDGSWCMETGCWDYSDSPTCSNKSECIWTTWASGGWCQEVQCWTWDGWSGGNESACVDNTYGFSCTWNTDPSNATNGWCYKDMTSTSCANFTTERTCMDTFYCWWQYTDWNDPSQGGNCSDPTNWGINTNNSISVEWNPGCYVFDMNSSDCGSILGCDNSTAGQCNSNSTHANLGEITSNGINCTMINESNLCNSIPILSSCCSWQGNNCSTNKLSTSCWDQIETPPADSCEGANNAEKESERKNNCDQIAGNPWYMPCQWNNGTKMCEFKSVDVFGNGTKSITKIENKRNCEAAGGKWVTENYCEGSISVPSGRCESKFDGEDNCNKACFACELKNSNGNPVNATNAESACKGSTLGICEYKTDTNAPNGIGYCNAKDQFVKGIAGDCDTKCGSCTNMGDPINNDSTKRPSYYCAQSKANSAEGGCKWIIDNSTSIGGNCVKKGDKTCGDACDRCESQTNCQNIGRTNIANQSGSCKWDGTADDGTCVSNIGDDVEVCWDGVDNTDNGLIDCSDPSCYSDSICGFVEGDCFIWQDSASCTIKNATCEWVTDKWGSWCDFKGSQCWRNDANETFCNTNENCLWSNGTGSGWCERDWSVAEQCMGLNRLNCTSAPCVWTNDTWCDNYGNGSDWCDNYGGWCDHQDFAPKNCWMYQSTSSECDDQTGCEWKVDEWSQPHCEVNWSGNCWSISDESTCNTGGCSWRTESWGSTTSSWCENNLSACWGQTTQNACGTLATASCTWKNYTWGGSCEPSCFNSTLTNDASSCNAVAGCYYVQEMGWCQDEYSEGCYTLNVSSDSTNCTSTTGCVWKNPGWCDPKGGGFFGGCSGGGGGIGMAVGADCYKYNGNQSYCTNKSLINISCGWMTELNPFCEVDWSTNCWQYLSTVGGCNVTNGCWWNADTSYCSNLMDQCWGNTSLQGVDNANACNENPYCNANAWGNCEPTCFSNTTQGACGTGCKWVTGWCNPSGMNDMFTGMEAGAPVPLGFDICDLSETTQSSVDICGYGMKDMGDSYGFGTWVYDFSNASVCNKIKVSSHVMDMAGGEGVDMMGGGTGVERTGDGNETIKYFVYLDTDGSTSGSCALSHNSSAVGYEFKFRYVSEWNVSRATAVESFNSYKCENSVWKAADIKISAWKNKMCSEIGGPMIALEKADLAKFPKLYNSTKDIRVVVATAGRDNNVSVPSDRVTPGWVTPGSIDFEIDNAFSYGADVAKFESILKNGYVQYEDCYNNIDDDSDGNIDCDDWDCQYSDNCTGVGVAAVGYVDTSSPMVTGVKIEEYPDAAIMMYDTNKPTNGTLLFYNNESTCVAINTSIYDVGVRSSNVREFKLWHEANIYNSSIDSLAYALANNTMYYYKLRVCDSNGKCAISKCSNFTTAESSEKCGYCNFVTRLKVPTGWNVSYDLDLDETYEHVQGSVCGPNAGMKTNYTNGRRANIRLEKSDGSAYFEFMNVTFTKSGLNDKVRSISNSDDLIYDTTENFVGLPSETRDKIINNLHPEVCRMKIPASGTCASLYHCDDSGDNCIDKTSESTLLDSTNCVWQLPYCEFSTWDEDNNPAASSSSSSSSSSGGGSSGGGGALSSSNASTAVSSGADVSESDVDGEGGVAGTGRAVDDSEKTGKLAESGGSLTWLWILIGVVLVVVILMIIYFMKKKNSV